jgi:hypothetical protein
VSKKEIINNLQSVRQQKKTAQVKGIEMDIFLMGFVVGKRGRGRGKARGSGCGWCGRASKKVERAD